MTLQERATAFAAAFPEWPASWPRIVREQDRDVLYATWLLGNDYRAKTAYYGSYPPNFLRRAQAFFPDVTDEQRILHAFSGSLPMGPYRRCDVRPVPDGPEFCCSIYELPKVARGFALVLADPPYSAEDATRYGTPMIDRKRVLAALALVTAPGGHLVWLDTQWPMHRKGDWLTVGRIAIIRSTNHRVRLATIFQRTEET